MLGARWKVGHGKSIRFWEDHWLDDCSLATQFWDLYVIANEKNVSIAKFWDENKLKISFRRRVSNRLMLSWLDLVSIVESITFTEDCDAIFWVFDGSGKFSVQSMYRTISSRGILPAHTPAVWQLSLVAF